MKFRLLKADEIDCRVSTCKENGLSLLLYKDARCDMNILDETVGEMNWQRNHTRDNANCIVSIWDKEKSQWVGKEDTGTESRADGEGNEKKGLASDSFKRSCFNWGIGRELYTSPFIWISASDCVLTKRGEKITCNDRFIVDSIRYEDNKISELVIKNIKTHKAVFKMGGKPPIERTKEEILSQKPTDIITEGGADFLLNMCLEVGSKPIDVCKYFGVTDFTKMTVDQFNKAKEIFESKVKK